MNNYKAYDHLFQIFFPIPNFKQSTLFDMVAGRNGTLAKLHLYTFLIEIEIEKKIER